MVATEEPALNAESVADDGHFLVKVTSWHLLTKTMFEDEDQKAIAEWMPEEYPSLCGFVADWEPYAVKYEVRDKANPMGNYTMVPNEWAGRQSDGPDHV